MRPVTLGKKRWRHKKKRDKDEEEEEETRMKRRGDRNEAIEKNEGKMARGKKKRGK